MAFPPRMKERIVILASLHDNLGQLVEELPHLGRHHAALGSLVARARELESRQVAVEGELRLINQARAELDKEGRDLRNQVAGALHGVFGLDNPELGKYGLKPRPRQIRRRRLSPAERVERLNREAERARAELEAREAAKAAAHARTRASS